MDELLAGDRGPSAASGLPVIKVVKIDETAYWCRDTVKAAGRIFGVYVYDEQSVTYCCEMSPSYALHFVESQTSRVVPDEMNQMMLEAGCDTPPVSYVHCRLVDAYPEMPERQFPEERTGQYVLFEADPESPDSVQAIEEALEFARGNAV